MLVDIAFDGRLTVTQKPRAAGDSNLSSREREIVRLVAEGLTDEQIGEKLSVGPRAVRSHLDHIRDKTGLRRRLELTRLAFELDLADDQLADPSYAEMRTFLFTDLERHTEMLQRLGDVAGRAALREHERTAQSAIGGHGGVAIKGTGDGYLASFGRAQRALACAATIQRACAEHDVDGWGQLKVRIGINAGEPIAEESDLFGSSVNLAARITALATGGQVLVSNVVKELVAGKAFRFRDRGETTLRGFDHPTRLLGARVRHHASALSGRIRSLDTRREGEPMITSLWAFEEAATATEEHALAPPAAEPVAAAAIGPPIAAWECFPGCARRRNSSSSVVCTKCDSPRAPPCSTSAMSAPRCTCVARRGTRRHHGGARQ